MILFRRNKKNKKNKKIKKRKKEKVVLQIKSKNTTNSSPNIIDYKNTKLLLKFIDKECKIKPRQFTGITSKQQRVLSIAIKRARMSGFVPFVASYKNKNREL